MLGSGISEGRTVGPVAGKRPKVALKPGRSLMDWVRLGVSGKDLQGSDGQIKKITMEELSQHDKEDDCWMLLRGKVYNITPYMEFHPGGIPELMRAAGKDGTEFFDEVHKWVNIESMLAKCFIGPIAENNVKQKLEQSSSVSKLLVQPASNLLIEDNSANTSNKASIPRYDWYQNEDSLTITIYTKNKDITEDNLIVDCSDGRKLTCKVLFPKRYYHINMQLESEISYLKVKRTSQGSGKLELLLQKSETEQKWSSLGTKLEENGELHEEKERDLVRRKCSVSAIKQITSNTKIFSLRLPKMVYYKCPIGYHVLIEETVQGIIIGKNYTVALDKFDYKDDNENDFCHLHLMIKIYAGGALTPILDQLKVGDSVTISDPIGNFNLSRLKKANSVFMISAGTGLTPMIRIMDYMARNKDVKRKARLLFANRHETDILWRDELDDFAKSHHDMIEIKYILSKPPEQWTGLRGRINKEVLTEFLSDAEKPSIEEELLICICGPDEFTDLIKEYLLSMKFTEKMIHCFLG